LKGACPGKLIVRSRTTPSIPLFIDTYKKKSKQKEQDTKARGPERLILLSIGAKINGWYENEIFEA
jgi:hypothetical protein